MLQKLAIISFTCGVFFFTACNSESETRNDQTFRDYRDFVTQTERDTVVPEDEGLDSTWYMRTSVIQKKYDSIHNNVNLTLNDLKSEQKQELAELDQRYKTAQSRINKKREDVSRRYKLREDLLGLKVKRDDLSAINAEQIAPTYQQFIDKLSMNYKNYSVSDWQHIEGWWISLNNRAQELSSDITSKDKSVIESAQQKYISLRQNANLDQPTK
jgi:hypothetical protein